MNKKVLVSLVENCHELYDQEIRPVLEAEDCDAKVFFTKEGLIPREQLLAEIVDAEGMIAVFDRIDKQVLDIAKHLKIVSVFGVGMGFIDLSYAKKKGIEVCNTYGANADSVADLTFGLMISMVRKINQHEKVLRNGYWERTLTEDVCGKTLGILGLGCIGKKVLKRAKGFDMEVLAYDLQEDQQFARDNQVEYTTFEEVLKRADIICIHLPLTEQTRGIIGLEQFRMMKDTSYIINVGRGGIIDEGALSFALKNQIIRGAALDVFDNEPIKMESPLLEFDNIVLTPHIAASTKESYLRMARASVKNLVSGL